MTPPDAPGRGVDVVLSAERADVGVRRAPRERVRVRREVVTEEVTVVVAVRREVLRTVREPLTPGSADAGSGDGPGAAGEALPLELVLSEERPVVGLEVVPYERVRVDVRSVPGTAAVTTTARRETAEVTTDPAADPATGPATGVTAATSDLRSPL
ncbi:DUF2382 domain-containing protein [Streptomyces sp. NP160]|uniref:DUF2382 domain-containing protein n=1 Tax=Streptomyces sp. NP160 TaxID=2586637 RepID=UPI0011182DC2|nr:DUF2382 domain-containing protein [Streptomyces sp. NP160]TNM67157.1 DUF2382 domain-containing protein [Streptomyces sp. NP160]